MKKFVTLPFLIVIVLSGVFAQQATSFLWEINSTDFIGGYKTTLNGSPKVITDGNSQVVEFDGVDDGLLINFNPLQGASEFTIEVVIKPYAGGNYEQRYFSIRQADNDNIRVLMEIRLKNGGWWLDTYLKYNTSGLTLLDTSNKSFRHPADEWVHTALVFKNDTMRHFINGKEELNGFIDFNPMTEGYFSIGMRYNKASFFKGAIKTVKITHKALQPKEFINQQPDTIKPVSVNSFKKPLAMDIIPNPVVSQANIMYSVAEPGIVTIKIYNLLGKESATLVNEYHLPGTYGYLFNASDYNRGMYLLAVQSNGNTATRKFMINRQ